MARAHWRARTSCSRPNTGSCTPRSRWSIPIASNPSDATTAGRQSRATEQNGGGQEERRPRQVKSVPGADARREREREQPGADQLGHAHDAAVGALELALLVVAHETGHQTLERGIREP